MEDSDFMKQICVGGNVNYYSTNIDVSEEFKQRMLDCGVTLPRALSVACLKRQCEFLAGRMCAHRALESLGKPIADIPVGKYREPIWQHGVVGSLSHSCSHAIAVCSERGAYRSIGVDVEQQLSARVAEKIGYQIVTDTECELAGDNEHSAFISAVFSAKEAVFKALFPLITRPMNFSFMTLSAYDDNSMHFSLSPAYCGHLDFSDVMVRYEWCDDTVFTLCSLAAEN